MSAWNAFFGGCAPQPNLELFRIAFGLTVALYYGKRLQSADLCLGQDSLAENLWRLRSRRIRASLFAVLPRSAWLARAVIAAGLVAAVGVAVGFKTPYCAALLLACHLMVTAELAFLATGLDFIVTIMSALLMLSPAGAAWSLDAPTDVVPATPVWTTRLMQIQVSLIYAFGVAQKLSERQWRSGWAVYYTLHAQVVAREGAALLGRGSALPRILTWSTIALQLVAPLGLWWAPARVPIVVALIGLHIGLDCCLRLWPFQWLVIACLLLFAMGGGW